MCQSNSLFLNSLATYIQRERAIQSDASIESPSSDSGQSNVFAEMQTKVGDVGFPPLSAQTLEKLPRVSALIFVSLDIA